MSELLKENQRVVFTGDSGKYGAYKAVYDHFKTSRIYGTIQGAKKRESYYVSPQHELIAFGHSLNRNIGGIVSVLRTDIQVIPEEQYAEYEQLLKDDEAACLARVEELKSRIHNPAKVSFMKRKFNFDDKQEIRSNLNFARLGTWDKKNDTFQEYQRNFRPSCCAFTKTTHDVDVYIPAVWLNYYGYTVYDLVEWCKFLSKCGIGFDYEYFGLGRLDELFKSNVTSNAGGNEEGFFESFNFGKNASSITPRGMDGYHKIIIKGAPSNMHTYLRFICLRYIYNHQYWTIPGHAMQIKKALGATVTHWQALLMAHLHQNYHGYYSLVQQNDRNPAIAHRPLRRGEEAQNIYNLNTDKHVDIFQTVESTMSRLRGASTMNGSFQYVYNLYRPEFDKFFADQDWVGLYKYLVLKKAEEEKAK